MCVGGLGRAWHTLGASKDGIPLRMSSPGSAAAREPSLGAHRACSETPATRQNHARVLFVAFTLPAFTSLVLYPLLVRELMCLLR